MEFNGQHGPYSSPSRLLECPFSYTISTMGTMPFYQKPSFRALFLAIVLAGTYAYELLGGQPLGTVVRGIGVDVLLLLVFSQMFLFCYAQFVAPVRSARDRGLIYGRLLLHLRGAHGPAVFIQNGRIVERRGETSRRGPGLAWLDSASAVVTRSDAGVTRALGPGVHFLGSSEKIVTTFSLHPQRCSIGPERGERIFEPPAESASADEQEEYAAAQAKRMSVTARTRDGNEVVPKIGLVFKLDAMPAALGAPGSRFGFASDAVSRAAMAEGVAASSDAETRSRVRWNQLPSLIAADLWREYLSKFTLDELFTPTFPALPDILQPEAAAGGFWNGIAERPDDGPIVGMLRRFNDRLEGWLEQRGVRDEATPESPFYPPREARAAGPRERGYTALELVAQMIKGRMTRAVVPVLDEYGRAARGRLESEEYKRLRERGVVVLDVEIEAIHFDPAVEGQIVRNWNTSWLGAAQDDRRHIEQLELLSMQAGRQKALLAHAGRLAQAIQADDPRTVSSAVQSLLRSAQAEVLSDERLSGRARSELQALSQIQRWAEAGGRD